MPFAPVFSHHDCDRHRRYGVRDPGGEASSGATRDPTGATRGRAGSTPGNDLEGAAAARRGRREGAPVLLGDAGGWPPDGNRNETHPQSGHLSGQIRLRHMPSCVYCHKYRRGQIQTTRAVCCDVGLQETNATTNGACPRPSFFLSPSSFLLCIILPRRLAHARCTSAFQRRMFRERARPLLRGDCSSDAGISNCGACGNMRIRVQSWPTT